MENQNYSVAVIGLGSMGMGAAVSCINAGLTTYGIDLNPVALEKLKAAGAKADQNGTLEEVYAAANLAKQNTRTVGFALTPCIVPEVGHSNFVLEEGEMAMGMGIHGEPGIWNGPIKTAKELAKESLDTILKDMPLKFGDEIALLVNGLGATSLEELYILSGDATEYLKSLGIKVYRTIVGEYATSMEMMGASISICKLDNELKEYIDYPVNTPFIVQK